MTPLRALLAAAVLVAVGCSTDDRSAAPTCQGAKLAVGVTAADAATALSRGPAASSVAVARGGTLFAAGSGIDEGCTADGSTPAGARLFLVQGSQRVSVAHVATSGADHSFSISFGVPATLQPGNASVVAQTTLDPHETPLATASVSVQ